MAETQSSLTSFNRDVTPQSGTRNPVNPSHRRTSAFCISDGYLETSRRFRVSLAPRDGLLSMLLADDSFLGGAIGVQASTSRSHPR